MEGEGRRRRSIVINREEEEEEETYSSPPLPTTTNTNKGGSRKRTRQETDTSDGPLAGKKKNTAVYVSGLPDDTTMDELSEYFGKYGVIMDDMFTGGPRIKMYEDEAGHFKGEALIVYLKEESARLATDLLDDSYFRLDVKIRVSEAQFSPTESGDLVQTKSGGSNKIDKRLWKQHMQAMSRKLEWGTDDTRSPEEEAALLAERRRQAKYARIVVLRGMFRVEEAANDPAFVMDLKSDLLAECEQLGEVTAVHVLTTMEEGVCTVKFREREAAAVCLRLMHGRYFDGRRIQASLYDGSFSLREREGKEERGGSGGEGKEEEEERLNKFGEWLEEQEE